LSNPENTFLFRTTEIDFGLPRRLPGQEIKAIIPSKDQVLSTRIMSGSEENGLDEKFVFPMRVNIESVLRTSIPSHLSITVLSQR